MPTETVPQQVDHAGEEIRKVLILKDSTKVIVDLKAAGAFGEGGFRKVSTSATALQAQSSLTSRLRTRQAMAEDLMKRADLAAAMVQWKILHTLDPGNVEFSRQLNATQTLIQQRVTTHMQLGERAFTQGDFKQATREFLRVLALNPQQPRPQTYLRQIEQRHLKNMMRIKLAGVAHAKEKAVPSPDQGPPH